MDNIKGAITGGVITLLIGGAAFTFSQQDVVDFFAEDTGLTKEQAEQYVNNVSEDELVSFNVMGSDYVTEGGKTLALADELDCVNYDYDWETESLSCEMAKSQLQTIGNTEQSLGKAFTKLGAETATKEDMSAVISYIDQLNLAYTFEIALAVFDNTVLDEMKMTNSYNKSLIKAALESE